MKVETAEEAIKDASYLNTLKELLYQLADDDFIISFRGAEWLGLAPHIEEDVAYSSITQNTMGHAFLYYQLLEELGEGKVDELAHERVASDRKNATYFEKKNGEGDYLHEPHFDWALTVVRQFLYEASKKVKLESLMDSSYLPLGDIAQKILMEQNYHLAHWKIWIRQLLEANQIAIEKIQFRLDEAWHYQNEIIGLGPMADNMEKYGLIENEQTLEDRWLEEVKKSVGDFKKGRSVNRGANGREGNHTNDLTQALNTLAEVYNTDRKAVW
ncbi:1,2-phenylacetyl-CoA epoxidase subunit PaaC [Halobacillus rhizosphaerae]|uniref:1,2-phenylacetyl-CoA epoxidase subunit PaaC n=1 Tax=Halobacillus rhizosphaerae TaxID=3064889 RepID=UPI00398A696B